MPPEVKLIRLVVICLPCTWRPCFQTGSGTCTGHRSGVADYPAHGSCFVNIEHCSIIVNTGITEELRRVKQPTDLNVWQTHPVCTCTNFILTPIRPGLHITNAVAVLSQFPSYYYTYKNGKACKSSSLPWLPPWCPPFHTHTDAHTHTHATTHTHTCTHSETVPCSCCFDTAFLDTAPYT